MIITVSITVVLREALLIFLCLLIVDICRLSLVLNVAYSNNYIFLHSESFIVGFNSSDKENCNYEEHNRRHKSYHYSNDVKHLKK